MIQVAFVRRASWLVIGTGYTLLDMVASFCSTVGRRIGGRYRLFVRIPCCTRADLLIASIGDGNSSVI